MSEILLSIVIPTRNRQEELSATLKNLIEVLGDNDEVEILVSDNSTIQVEIEITDNRIRVLRPDTAFDTAEENLFFAIGSARGRYLWPLGDDDVVLRSGLYRVLQECSLARFDAFTFNARNVSHEYQMMGWSRVLCYSEELQIPYHNFLERLGYWSIPAGISLTIYKKSLVSNHALELVRQLRSKIYSHVTLYAIIFKDCKFAFLNFDLVEYRTNLYDISHETTNHWKGYSSKRGLNDRFFWLNGFIEHLQLLERFEAIDHLYISKAIDIGHFNHRIPLQEHMLNMLIDQLLLDFSDLSIIPLDHTEIMEILEYMEQKSPSLIGYYRDIRNALRQNYSQGEKLSIFEKIRKNFSEELLSYPFRRFYNSRVYGFLIYETPLGWLALPQEPVQNSGLVPHIRNLDQMLLGIDFPKVIGIYTANTRDELLKSISGHEWEIDALDDVVAFQLVPAIYKQANSSEQPPNLIGRLWRRLPLKLKIFIRRSISKNY